MSHLSLIPKEIFNYYFCRGKFSFSEDKFSSEFHLIQYIDGKMEILIFGSYILNFLVEFSKQSDYCSIKGNLLNEFGEIYIK